MHVIKKVIKRLNINYNMRINIRTGKNTGTNKGMQQELFGFPACELNVRANKMLAQIRSAALLKMGVILEAISKMERPSYLSPKWHYIRQNYEAAGKWPSENAIYWLEEFSAKKSKDENAACIIEGIKCLRMLMKLEEIILNGEEKRATSILERMAKMKEGAISKQVAYTLVAFEPI